MAAISSASGAVGRPAIVLWDLLNTSIPNDVNIVKLGFEIIELAKSFEAYKLSLARGYHNGSLTPRQSTELCKIGYELNIQDPSSKCPDYYFDMIFWLLDNRLGNTFGPYPSANVIIVTSNSMGLQSLMQRLRQRGIHTVLVSSKPFEGYLIEVDIFINIEDLFHATRKSSFPAIQEKPFLYLSTTEEGSSPPPPPTSKSPGNNFRIDPFDFTSDGIEDHRPSKFRMDASAFSQEETMLYAELYNAFQARNTRVTVAVLRKIYTKQTRGFRIPDLLREIFPVLGENGILINPSASAYILYALSCVQWCLGMPAGEKPDSYKSKMNKNIGRWLIKELQRKGIPPQLPADVTHAAQSVISHILEHNIDADFAQELASIIGIPGFVPVPKMPSPSPRCTAESPLHSYETRFSYDSTNGHHVPYSNPIAHNVIGRADPFHPIKELVSSNASIHQLHAALPRLSVDHRLFLLVAKTHGGLLGARIPSLYREIFGERLRLQGRKLKDILLASSQIEMVGTDGPGDKLFRLVSDNAPSALDPLLNTPRSSGLSHVSEERFVPIIKDSGSSGAIGTISSSSTGTISDSLWSSGSIFHRFRAFPRDEGSQLDRIIASLSLSSDHHPDDGENNQAKGDALDQGNTEIPSPQDTEDDTEIDYLRFQSFGMGQYK